MPDGSVVPVCLPSCRLGVHDYRIADAQWLPPIAPPAGNIDEPFLTPYMEFLPPLIPVKPEGLPLGGRNCCSLCLPFLYSLYSFQAIAATPEDPKSLTN